MNLDTCQFVIWGHKDGNTFSHIHEAMYRALKYMNKSVRWLDGSSTDSDFDNTLFLSEHQVAGDIPVTQDGFYVIHNLNGGDEKANARLAKSNKLHYGVLTYNPPRDSKLFIDTGVIFDKQARSLDMIWATNLLPHEIEENKRSAEVIKELNEINWVGSWHDQLLPFRKACQEHGVDFHRHGGFGKPVSLEESIYLTKRSRFAPAIVSKWQQTVGYIPCRIFKNISYGHYGVTNSQAVNDLFSDRLVYDPNSYSLFSYANSILNAVPRSDLFYLMDVVAKKHTFLNRLDAMFKAVRELA